MKTLFSPTAAFGLLILSGPSATGASLEAYFPLDGNLTPGAGTGVTATAMGTNPPKYTAGKLGEAGDFDNDATAGAPSDWAFHLGNQDALYAGDFSISLWVQTTNTNDAAIIGNSNWTSGGNTGWLVSTLQSGGREGKVKTTTGARQNEVLAFHDGNWHLVTLVVDNTHDLAFWYLDGVPLNGAGDPIGDGSLAAGLNTTIGGSGAGNYAGTANLDDVAFFSGMLTASQIAWLYNGGAGRTADQFSAAPTAQALTWTGAASPEWSTQSIAAPKNWVLTDDGLTAADYADVDTLVFDDTASGTTVDISQGDVSPVAISFENATKNFTLTGSHGLAGGVEVPKNGDGTLTLSNPNVHTGRTHLTGGTLVIDHSLALQNSTLEGDFSAGAVHRFGSVTSATFGGLAGNADLALANASSQAVALTVGGNNQSTVHGGEISGAGSLAKAGTGRLALAFDNTFTGGVTVAAGILQAQREKALSTGPVISTGGSIEFGIASGVESVIPNDFTLPTDGAGSISMFGVFGSGGAAPTPDTTVRLTGRIRGGTADRTFRFADTNLSGEHDDTLILDNPANDFIGTVHLERGTLAFTSDAALGDPENDIVHFSENLLGKLRFDADGIVLNAHRAIDLPGAANPRPFDTRDFTATVAGPISGTGTLVKQGAGTLILTSADSTLSGALTVAAGTLEIDGTVPASTGLVTVAADATLAGSGSLQRDVTVTGGTLSPGAGVGIGALHDLGALTLAASSKLAFEISDWTGAAGSGYDTLQATSLDLTADPLTPVTVVITPRNLANFTDAAKSFTLISTTGGITGFTPGAFVIDSSALPAASSLTWSVQVQGNSLMLVYGTSSGTPFQSWIASKGLSGAQAAFDADPDRDGIANGIEFILGGEPNPANAHADSSALLPTVSRDANVLRFTFRRSAASATSNPAVVQYDTDLSGVWTAAADTANGVVVTVTPGIEPGIDRVEVAIPLSLAVDGKLFVRLSAAE